MTQQNSVAAGSNQARSRARLKLVQALYQSELNPQSSQELCQQFQQTQDMSATDIDFFTELLQQVIASSSILDEKLQPYLDIAVDQLDVTERCILRLAMYELLNSPATPHRVIINEAVKLAKKFGATDGHKYINGVLDSASKALRPHG